MPGETNQVRWRGVQPVEGIRGVWPVRNATRVDEYAGQVGLGTSIVYTVPAGKILFIASGYLASRLRVDALAKSNLHVRDTGDAVQYYIFIQQFQTAGQLSDAAGFLPALEAAAGWDVAVNSSHASLDAQPIVHGWLEDA